MNIADVFTLDDDRDVQVKARYTRGRPAPPCSNHDSPAFSDPGDPPELEIVSTKTLRGDRWTEAQLGTLDLDYLGHRLYDLIERGAYDD